MSIETSAAAGLPVVNQALEPTSVRHGSAATQKAYQSALAFEQVLVEQLSKSMTATLGGESEGGSGSEEGESSGFGSGSGELSSMLPQALSAGVMNAGGLGLAAQMTKSLESLQSGASASAGAGSASPAAADPSAGDAAATVTPSGGIAAATTGGTSS
jgi:Rod binding domain-containing protein